MLRSEGFPIPTADHSQPSVRSRQVWYAMDMAKVQIRNTSNGIYERLGKPASKALSDERALRDAWERGKLAWPLSCPEPQNPVAAQRILIDAWQRGEFKWPIL